MSIGIQGVGIWQTWRQGITAADSAPSPLAATEFHPTKVLVQADGSTAISPTAVLNNLKPLKLNPNRADRFISIHPFTGVAIKFLATADSDTIDTNTTVDVTISGWMFPGSIASIGPGQILYKARLKWHDGVDAGALWDEADVPAYDLERGPWTAARYGEIPADGYDVTTAGFYDAANGIVIGSAGAATGTHHSCLLLPTIGYSYLLLEVDAVGSSLASFGALWRGVTKEGVL